MPLIHVYMHAGRDLEIKQNLAMAIAKSAHEVLGAPISAFTVVIEDVDREGFEEREKAVLEPLRDMVVMERGELVQPT